MSLVEVLKIPRKCPWKHWSQNIVLGDTFFQLLLREPENTDPKKICGLVSNWDIKFDRNPDWDKPSSDAFKEGLNHIRFLAFCAAFANENRDSLEKIFFRTPEKRDELRDLMGLMNEKSFEFRHVPDSAAILISAFYWKGFLTETRSVHFAAVDESGTKGQLYTLELRRIKSVSCVIADPTFVLAIDGESLETKRNFVDAIETAFSINRATWRSEYKELEQRLAVLERDQKDGKVINKSELEGVRTELNFLDTSNVEGSDNIERYGILWRVKPFNRQSEHFDAVSGESIGLAAYVGIYFALRNKYPDERSIYSAAILGDETTGFKLEKVEGIPVKIQAALEVNRKAKAKDPNGIPPFEGFAIHEDNFTDIDNDNELKARIEDEGLQIMILNAQGSVVKIFPS